MITIIWNVICHFVLGNNVLMILHTRLHSGAYKKNMILTLSREPQILYFKIKFCYDCQRK